MRKSDVFPSKFMKCADLNGKPMTVTIKRAELETLKSPDGKEQNKTVLYFHETKKALPLNVTNWDACAEACGDDDTDGWLKKQIELYPAKAQMGGKTFDCIRIRPLAQRELANQKSRAPEPLPADDMSDEIPF